MLDSIGARMLEVLKSAKRSSKREESPKVDFLDNWEAQINFAIGSLEQLKEDIAKWREQERINAEELAQHVDYLHENGIDALVDEMMYTAIR